MIVLTIQNVQNPKLLDYFKQSSLQRGIWYLDCSDIRVPRLKHTQLQVKHYYKTKSTLMNLVLNWDQPNTKGKTDLHCHYSNKTLTKYSSIILGFVFTFPVPASWSSDLRDFWLSQKVLLMTPDITSKLLAVQSQKEMAQ